MLHFILAGLRYDLTELLDSHSLYTDTNATLRDQMWLDIDVDDGMIALDDADVARWGLPASQRFPWDNSKSIYLLHAHHNLHCAVSGLNFQPFRGSLTTATALHLHISYGISRRSSAESQTSSYHSLPRRAASRCSV